MSVLWVHRWRSWLYPCFPWSQSSWGVLSKKGFRDCRCGSLGSSSLNAAAQLCGWDLQCCWGGPAPGCPRSGTCAPCCTGQCTHGCDPAHPALLLGVGGPIWRRKPGDFAFRRKPSQLWVLKKVLKPCTYLFIVWNISVNNFASGRDIHTCSYYA